MNSKIESCCYKSPNFIEIEVFPSGTLLAKRLSINNELQKTIRLTLSFNTCICDCKEEEESNNKLFEVVFS